MLLFASKKNPSKHAILSKKYQNMSHLSVSKFKGQATDDVADKSKNYLASLVLRALWGVGGVFFCSSLLSIFLGYSLYLTFGFIAAAASSVLGIQEVRKWDRQNSKLQQDQEGGHLSSLDSTKRGMPELALNSLMAKRPSHIGQLRQHFEASIGDFSDDCAPAQISEFDILCKNAKVSVKV